MKDLELRYGCNPHQKPARVFVKEGEIPFEVLGGSPGYINLLDAMNSWLLVKELKEATGMASAASFKHVSPAGAAIGLPMSDDLKKSCFAEGIEHSPVSSAYARARGVDRLSSFGDWAAVSDTLDVPTAKLLARDVSDGVIAPGYEPEALEILRKKQDGKYRVIQMDPSFEAKGSETRDLHGVWFEQPRNDGKITKDLFREENIASKRKDIPEEAKLDLLIATIAVKYTQSNSVTYAWGGQTIGIGAGQQSRIHCVRLAGEKADLWYLRLHPKVLGLEFKKDVGRAEQNNAIDLYLREGLSPAEDAQWKACFDDPPAKLTAEEKAEWLSGLKGVSLSSDAFFPFRDSLDRAKQSGVEYVLQPGGAVRDDMTTAAADEHGMVMVHSGIRLFHH
jgi:phosphoribosylaminoimidazolecarboxamide formyltransferase/IMP cyclohydrolase